MTTETVETKKSTIRELGPTLPLGVVGPSGARGREIGVRPWRIKEEKELGRLRAKHSDANINLSKYISIVVSTMCTRLGGADFESVADPLHKQIAVSSMLVPDVFYAYIWLRIQAIGPELVLNMKCPKCRSEFKYEADLLSTEVVVPENPDKVSWTYKLQTPISLRGKQVSNLHLGPMPWASLENAQTFSNDLASGRAAAILGSVRRLGDDEHETVLAPDELDEMTKRDFEALSDEINERHLGPVMAVEVVCPMQRCDFTWHTPLDWGYDSFFSNSSVSRAKKS